jgi:hypothetical protein
MIFLLDYMLCVISSITDSPVVKGIESSYTTRPEDANGNNDCQCRVPCPLQQQKTTFQSRFLKTARSTVTTGKHAAVASLAVQ